MIRLRHSLAYQGELMHLAWLRLFVVAVYRPIVSPMSRWLERRACGLEGHKADYSQEVARPFLPSFPFACRCRSRYYQRPNIPA